MNYSCPMDFTCPQEQEISCYDSVSSVGSSSSSTSSQKLKAKASSTVATMMVKHVEEEQALEEEVATLKKKMAVLKAKHEAERAKAELKVYEDEETEPTVQKNIHVPPSSSYSPPSANRFSHPCPAEYSTASPEETFLNFLKNQQLMMQSMASAFQLPKPEMTPFDGNPLNYWRFIRNFEENIHQKATTESEKLNYLLQFSTERVKDVIKNCVLIHQDYGYTEARRILEERFGDPYIIACASVEKVTNGPPIKQSDRAGLLAFADSLKDCEMTLKSIGYLDEVNSADNLRKIAERFPHHMKAKWLERVRVIRENGLRPRINDLATFTSQAARAANDPVFGQIMERDKERNPLRRPPKPTKNSFSVQTKESPQARAAVESTTQNQVQRQTDFCVNCNSTDHSLTKCESFNKKKYEDKCEFLKKNRLCFNCFKGHHIAKQCFKKAACTVKDCDRKHQTTIHPPADPSKKDKDTGPQVNSNVASTKSGKRVCLPIVPVRVCGKNSETIVTYALLDKGSDSSLCESTLIKSLGITGREHSFSLSTIERKESQKKGQVVELSIKPLEGEEIVELPAVITVDEIPVSQSCIAKQEDVEKWPHLKGIEIPEVRGKVSLLIGNDVPEVFWVQEERRGKRKEPYAVKSILGWTVLGPTDSFEDKEINVNITNTGGFSDPLLDQLKKFWITDEANTSNKTTGMSVEDKIALQKMESSVKYVNGHYQLSLPWKYKNPYLPNNKYLAESRLKMLKRKFDKDEGLFTKYKSAINEYIDKGYAQQVPISELDNKEKVWYLPHHAVVNPNKPEKVRVVFDCAAKYKGTSLNDQLLQGPDLTNNLFGVLTRFRQEPVAIMADVEGMFNQVKVDPEDTDALRFLWWPNGDTHEDPIEMQMLVHLFGATSSPSCANFSLCKTAEDNKQDFKPETSKSVNQNFYVDDLLKSVKTPEEAVTLSQELKEMLKRGGFNLTKWTSNSKDVMDSIPDSERAKSFKNLNLDDTFPVERALGVMWDVESDKLTIKTEVSDKPQTRRGILSTTSSIYDPLGLVSPFILPAKKIIQDLCKENHGWDDPVPKESLSRWDEWLSDLPKLSSISIDRCIKPKEFGEIARAELHTFCDASQIGYGAVSYVRLVNDCGDVHCSFIAGKSRLAPLKTLTIPRLELSAAVVAVELENKIRQEMEISLDESVFWTDSTAVLQYIHNTKKRFKVYVANRVAAIHEGSNPDQWKHVRSIDNPADDASRGLKGEEMVNATRWVKGPSFLWKSKESWPEQPINLPQLSQDDEEVKKETQVFQASTNTCDSELPTDKLINKYSSWYDLKKGVAWLLRFKSYMLYKYGHKESKEHIVQSSLTVEEIKNAETEVIKYVQRQHFQKEIMKLQAKEPVQKSSKLIKLNPKMREDGMLIVGGRLNNASVSDQVKHPVIVPGNSPVSTLIVRDYHQSSCHSGKEHTLSLIREKFWIVKARVLVRQVINKCFICKRRQAVLGEQQMSDLPEDRVTPEKPPFTFVGVDCFGPMYVKQGRSQVKRYGCLFTCLVTRAVHIEVLHSMDTDSFIDALSRFINRRGRPEVIRSDNGTNFKGSQRELSEELMKWNQAKIEDCLRQREIKWKFNPPAASNFGGVWERIIRSIKSILRVILKDQVVTDETLATLLVQVEGILNSRPITRFSDDPKDQEPLTPNHLLLLKDQKQLPPGIFKSQDAYSRRWKQVQFIADQFWKRWTREYLPALQERQKWLQKSSNIKADDIVLVSDEKTSRGQWPLGRVVEAYQGKDGLVRSVKIKYKDGFIHRPINKICLLESVINQASTQVPKEASTQVPKKASTQASIK